MSNPSSPASEIVIARPLDLGDIAAVARRGACATLDASARAQLASTRAMLEAAIAAGDVIYGVNTGFGALSETHIAVEQLGDLQRNLLRSHAVGVGPALDESLVRACLLMRAHTFALGASGVRPELTERLLEMIRLGIHPVVPAQGSVGASGDLAPLAHLALPVIGEGKVWVDGVQVPAGPELARHGLKPFELGPKEGLSLINGTQVSTAIAALSLHDSLELLASADIIGALSLDAYLGTSSITDPRIHAGKPHRGQLRSAQLIAKLIAGSDLSQSHMNCGQVQDAYSLRCMPQVHGAVRDALRYATNTVTIEVNSFTDNPLVLLRPEGGFDVVSGGNFHAAPVALVSDHATAAMTTLSTISERRLDRFLNPDSSRGLPAFLANHPGVESGFMMAQVTATALASESKSLSFPASVDTIPTSAGKEDHVSMGPIAARKLAMVVANTARVLAIEASIAARAIDLRKVNSSEPLMRAHAKIREYVAPFDGDRSMSDEFEALAEALCRGELREAAGVASELHPPVD